MTKAKKAITAKRILDKAKVSAKRQNKALENVKKGKVKFV